MLAMRNHPYRSDGCTYREDGQLCGADANDQLHLAGVVSHEETEVNHVIDNPVVTVTLPDGSMAEVSTSDIRPMNLSEESVEQIR
jgi:hypothetical protein